MNDWFEDWAINHATIFGLSEDAEIAAIMAWREALGACEEELRAATVYLSKNPEALTVPPNMPYPGKTTVHLMALRRHVLSERVKRYAETSETWEDTHGTCARCRSSGFVVVPHIRCVKDGAWVPISLTRSQEPVFYTFAVLCPCSLGHYKREHNKATFMTLERYQVLNPHWAAQMALHRRQDTAMAIAEEKAVELDRSAIAGRIGLMPGERN